MAAWNPELYQNQHSFVWKYGTELLPLLDPRPGEEILDIGCGTGQLTARIAESGATVTGFDSSPQMISEAGAHFPQVRFFVADVRTWSPSQAYDAVFSNAALHWVTDAGAAVRNIARALKPGGRFVAEFGGHGNIRLLLEKGGLPNPWYFPTIGEYATLLEKHGLETRQAWLFDRTTVLEDPERGLRDWLTMFGKHWQLSESDLDGLEERLRPYLFREGRWVVDYRRIRVHAVRLA
jgi:SAM-dependent methyltransferase